MTESRLIISEQELAAIIQLDGAKRYQYFLKSVVDWEAAWGLWGDGWVVAGDPAGTPVFPLWPAKEFAEACADGPWVGTQAAEITLEEMLEGLLPGLHVCGMLVGVFYTPRGKGATLSGAKLFEELCSRIKPYE